MRSMPPVRPVLSASDTGPHCTAVPICLAGFFLLPDTPATTQTRLLSAEERAYAAARVGAHPQGKLDRTLFRRVFARWHVYVFSLLW